MNMDLATTVNSGNASATNRDSPASLGHGTDLSNQALPQLPLRVYNCAATNCGWDPPVQLPECPPDLIQSPPAPQGKPKLGHL